MWTAVAVAVTQAAHEHSPEAKLLKEELYLREHNLAVKDAWLKYSTLKMLLDPAHKDAYDKYIVVLKLSRK